MSDSSLPRMAAELSFQCRTCGDVHAGIPAFHFAGPAQLDVVPPEEFDARVDLTDDGCTIDLDGRHHFVRGQLEIPIQGTDDHLTWSVWCSLSAESFERYVALFEDTGRAPGASFFGWLCNALPGYPDTMFLKSRVHVRPYPLRPRVELERTDHPLAIDQHLGISRERAIALAESLLHGADVDRSRGGAT